MTRASDDASPDRATATPPSAGGCRALDISTSVDDDTVTVSPAGEIDSVTAPDLRRVLLNCLTPGCRKVVLDLSAVTFLNSAALTVLAEAHHIAQADGVELTLSRVSGTALRPLQITGLATLLRLPAASADPPWGRRTA